MDLPPQSRPAERHKVRKFSRLATRQLAASFIKGDQHRRSSLLLGEPKTFLARIPINARIGLWPALQQDQDSICIIFVCLGGPQQDGKPGRSFSCIHIHAFEVKDGIEHLGRFIEQSVVQKRPALLIDDGAVNLLLHEATGFLT